MIQEIKIRIYQTFNGRLYSLCSHLGCYLAFVYFWFYKKNNQVVLAPTSAIGDVLYVLSFWENFGKQGGVFYISDRYKDFLESFQLAPKIKIVYLQHGGFFHCFLMMFECCKNHKVLRKLSKKRGIIFPVPHVYKNDDFIWNGNKPKGIRHQLSRILDLPLDPISLHHLTTISIKSIPNFEQSKQKICVLNPYSNSMQSSLLLFEKIAEELKKRDFIVYTNVVNGQKEIRGTLSLECSLQELYSIAKEIPLIVSLRSGILDLLIPSNINMFVVYGVWKVPFVQDEDYSIKEWHPKGKLREVSIKTKSEEKIVEDFQSFLQQLRSES